MATNTVVLVGFQNQPNLGIGYLAAVLLEHGYDVQVLDFESGRQHILESIRGADPLIVGLSIIFQYYTPDFAELVAYLRENGVTCLICAGGHYPSLRYEETLEAIPGLDCVVLFEGEYTLLDLAERAAAGQDWRDVPSIAYRAEGRTHVTPLRPLIPDLDALPAPYRQEQAYDCLGIHCTSILASRGCPRGCSFCSIRRFYSIPPGRIRRTRSPQNVVEEMVQLYREHDVRVYLFQDDDFSFASARDRAWADEFADHLRASGLHESVIWKISCRADEIEPQILHTLRSVGLFLIYLGIESGNETGLRTLNKHLTVEDSRRAVRVIKEAGLRCEFGFMLFDPSSTVDLVLENIRFLRDISGDISAPIPFCKMLPYAGTDIEAQLREAGRLSGDVRHPDYGFADERADAWYAYLSEVFRLWIYGRDCVLSHLRWSLFELDILERFYPRAEGLDEHRERLGFLTGWYNEIFCRIVEDSAEFFRTATPTQSSGLQSIYEAAEQQRLWLEERLDYQRHAFLSTAGLPAQAASARQD